MKLHYYSGSTLPSHYANAVHVMKMCQAFAKSCGAQVTLLAKAGADEDTDLFAYYGVEPCFEVIRTANPKIPTMPALIRAAKAKQIAAQADIVYGRDPWAISAIAGKNIPFAFELHEIPQGRLQKHMLKAILKSKNMRGLVVITEGLRDAVVAFAPDIDPNKILVAPDGADIPAKSIKAMPLHKIDGTDYQTGYAGSLYKGKGIELIIKIAQKAPKTGFHIFGGPQSELEKWQSQNPPANIHFYGHIPHHEVAPRLAACDALLAPYMPQIHIGTGADIGAWISPLKLFEYMALKKPILCSDLPVLNEIMVDGQNCRLLNSDHPEYWVKALEELKTDPASAKAMTDLAFKQLKALYSWDVRAQNIYKFIK